MPYLAKNCCTRCEVFCGRIVVVQDPVAIPPFSRSVSANWFTQTSQDLHVEFLVTCLAVGRVLVVYDTLRIEERSSRAGVAFETKLDANALFGTFTHRKNRYNINARVTSAKWANAATCNLCRELLRHVRTCQDWLQTLQFQSGYYLNKPRIHQYTWHNVPDDGNLHQKKNHPRQLSWQMKTWYKWHRLLFY